MTHQPARVRGAPVKEAAVERERRDGPLWQHARREADLWRRRAFVRRYGMVGYAVPFEERAVGAPARWFGR